MPADVSIHVVPARMLAAVRRRIRISQVGVVWRPALDQVWDFLRQHPGLRTDGHNVFLYHHPADRESPTDVDFGVEVTGSFEQSEQVFSTETPAGRVASALHVGPYERLSHTHEAIHSWAKANTMIFGGSSWEISGDWTEDAAKLETRVEYLLL